MQSVTNNLRSISQQRQQLSRRYYTEHPLGGYNVNDDEEYILSEDLSSLVLLDVVAQLGSSPESDSTFLKKYNKIKIKKLGSYKKIKDHDSLLNENCSICLDTFKKGEYQRTLRCNHTFHKKCVDKWFCKDKSNCPMCRNEII
jgi:hypothetical protein